MFSHYRFSAVDPLFFCSKMFSNYRFSAVDPLFLVEGVLKLLLLSGLSACDLRIATCLILAAHFLARNGGFAGCTGSCRRLPVLRRMVVVFPGRAAGTEAGGAFRAVRPMGYVDLSCLVASTSATLAACRRTLAACRATLAACRACLGSCRACLCPSQSMQATEPGAFVCSHRVVELHSSDRLRRSGLEPPDGHSDRAAHHLHLWQEVQRSWP